MPPSYGTQAYWDERFKNESIFEWLVPPDSLTPYITKVIERHTADPRILHIGCGSSYLSFHLRELVQSAKQVTNVDYSEVAIQNCVQHEKRLKHFDLGEGGMIWKAVDLLCASSVNELTARDGGVPDGFDLIVDKSTSDCICCADDVTLPLPYSDCALDSLKGPSTTCFKIHPLHVLAVHLAFLAKPGITRWMCLSYSTDRFPFLSTGWNTSEASTVNAQATELGFPDPRTLWRIEHKQEVAPKQEQHNEDHDRSYVHRPATVHWLYTLLRTETML
ncbi:hypothetical protein BKA67DRAFT_8341 [Truncatella angustata]|uniref:Methyltransferase domain-containing protein n=1 Tax=Truncatella angustata TaxID=152316 RepID=A0A9P8UVY9_9PEZI|nr:uncharacterized protein BKA67DRAFT_8341 [Truncatella angustata]KAH6659212.1 hypothetical protein BKA67DRAFT_8341 [Truncatella angustata]